MNDGPSSWTHPLRKMFELRQESRVREATAAETADLIRRQEAAENERPDGVFEAPFGAIAYLQKQALKRNHHEDAYPDACQVCKYAAACDNGERQQCRIAPPTAFNAPPGHMLQQDRAVWPIVSNDDWCAKFERDVRKTPPIKNAQPVEATA